MLPSEPLSLLALPELLVSLLGLVLSALLVIFAEIACLFCALLSDRPRSFQRD